MVDNENIALFIVPDRTEAHTDERILFSVYLRNLTRSVLYSVTLFVYCDDSLQIDTASFEPSLSESDGFDTGIKLGNIDAGETRIFTFTATPFHDTCRLTAVNRVHIRFSRYGKTDFRVSPRACINVIAQEEQIEATPSVCTLLYSDFFLIERLLRVLDVYIETKSAVITTFGVVLDMVVTIVYLDTDSVTQTQQWCRCTLLQACPAEYDSPIITYGEYEVTQNGNRILLDVPITLTQ